MKVSMPSSVIGHRFALRQAVPRRDHERQRVGVNHFRLQPLVAGIVADHAQFQVAVHNLAGILLEKLRRTCTLTLGYSSPVSLDVLQQIEHRRFVRADHQPPGRIVAQFGQRVFQLLFAGSRNAGHIPARCGPRRSASLLAGPVDQLLAQLALQPLQRQRNRRLRAQQFLRGARKALLAGHRQKTLREYSSIVMRPLLTPLRYYDSLSYTHYKFANLRLIL